MALLAYTIAISCAFASMLPFPKMAWVKVRVITSSAYICLPTQLTCTNFGGVTCRVNVMTQIGPLNAAARASSSCNINLLLTENTDAPIGTFSSIIYDIVDIEE